MSAEIVLRYERRRWRAQGCGLDLEFAELRDLDAAVEQALARRGRALVVHVRFDTSALPAWLRQYHAHYCNYSLHVAPRTVAQ